MEKLEAALHFLVRLRLRGTQKALAGVVVGLLVNTATGSGSITDAVRRVLVDRPLAWVAWPLLSVYALVSMAPLLDRKLGARRSHDARLAARLASMRFAGLLDRSSISVDGAITLQRCPHLHDGWRLVDGDIQFTHHKVAWEPPEPRRAERDRHRENLLGSGDNQDGEFIRFLENPTAFTDSASVLLIAESVLFSNVVFFREVMLPERPVADYVNDVFRTGRIDFPHGTSAQVVVVTTDRRVLLLKRGNKVRWFRGSWSCSFEETMTADDIRDAGNSSAALRRLIRRSMREEIGLLEDEGYRLDNVRMLSVFVEAYESLLSVPMLFIVPLDIDSAALELLLSMSIRNDDEISSWLLVRENHLAWYVMNGSCPPFHPTSRYRMLMYLLHVSPGFAHLATQLKNPRIPDASERSRIMDVTSGAHRHPDGTARLDGD